MNYCDSIEDLELDSNYAYIPILKAFTVTHKYVGFSILIVKYTLTPSHANLKFIRHK